MLPSMYAGIFHTPVAQLAFRNDLPRFVWIVAGMALVIPIGVLDVLTGPNVPLSMFNVVPVLLVALCSGRWAAMWPALAAGALAFMDSFEKLPHDLNIGFVIWNFADEAILFVMMAELGARLREAFLRQKALATLDALTGLSNMRGFREHAEQELSQASREHGVINAAFLDCDNFKKVNDSLGHAEGDRVLRTVGNVLRANLRSGDVAGRLGGDEFAILLPMSGASKTRVCMERVQAALRQAMSEQSWPVTFSIGVATFEPPPASVDSLLSRIDNLQYQIKHSGKNRMQFELVQGGPVAAAAA